MRTNLRNRLDSVKEGGVSFSDCSHLQPRVEVSVQPLHDEQHGDAGAASVGVIDHRTVQVDEPLVFGQRPDIRHTGTDVKFVINKL